MLASLCSHPLLSSWLLAKRPEVRNGRLRSSNLSCGSDGMRAAAISSSCALSGVVEGDCYGGLMALRYGRTDSQGSPMPDTRLPGQSQVDDDDGAEWMGMGSNFTKGGCGFDGRWGVEGWMLG